MRPNHTGHISTRNLPRELLSCDPYLQRPQLVDPRDVSFWAGSSHEASPAASQPILRRRPQGEYSACCGNTHALGCAQRTVVASSGVAAMSILRVVGIAITGLVVSCAQVTTVPPAPPPTPQVAAPTAAPAPAPPAATEGGGAARGRQRVPLPTPLTADGQPVKWWFVFKFNAQSFPACGASSVKRSCTFGGTVQGYSQYGQQFVYASDSSPTLQKGSGCVGDTKDDPLGATFGEIYGQPFHYVVWNDQFYNAPKIQGCSQSCSAPWGHSKGTLIWNDAGDGMVLQVTTPSWPASGSQDHPRAMDGNTLGCVKDNNVLASQHFFALKLSKDDVLKVLGALQNASVVTDTGNPGLVSNGGPADIQSLVSSLGTKSHSTAFTKDTLSTGVTLISKPSDLNVPPWQLVSSVLGSPSLRTATWWASPKIYTTTAARRSVAGTARFRSLVA